MELKADSTALLIVDMQERFASAIFEFEPIANRVKGLIEAAKQLDVSVLATEQYPQGLGSTVENIRSVLPPNTPVFEKLTFSCFDCEPFRKELIKQKSVEVTTSSDDLSYFLLVWNVVTILQHFLFCKWQGIQECLHRRFPIAILPAVRT